MGSIRNNSPGLDVSFTAVMRCGGVDGMDRMNRVDRACGWGADVIMLIGGRSILHCCIGLLVGRVINVPRFEAFQTFAVSIKLAGDLASMIIPFLSRSKAAESGVVLGVIEIHDLTEYSH